MKIHIVKNGDTLFELSKKYNVPLQKLIEANPQIANPDKLNVGDKVKIPAVAVPIGGEPGNTYKHVVKQGDTLWKLSKAWGLPLQSLIAANPQLNDPNQLKVGDIVNIPSGSGAAGGAANPHGANTGLSPAQTGKKNTAPIAGTGTKAPTNVKPEMTAPKPVKEAPKAQPIQAAKPKEEPVKVEPVKVEPPKQQPVHVEPPKMVPMDIKIEVEQIQYESTKLQPIHYEPPKYEPAKYEPMNYEPANYGPTAVSPYTYQPMKGEPMGVSPYAYQPMKGEPMGVSPYAYEPMKGEPTGVSPYANGPMKGEPTGVSPYAYQPMKGEPTGVSPYAYQSMKGEPTGVSPYAYEPMKGEPTGVSPYANEPMKGEPTGVSPYAYEPMKGEPTGVSPYANEPMKGEPTGVSPYANEPNVYPAMHHQPVYPNLPVPQPPSLLPAMGYAPSPCGCSGASPYSYQSPESYHPFAQYQVPAEPVSAFYDNPQYPQMGPTALSPASGEYPGISNANAPVSQIPNLGGVSHYGENMPNAGIQPYGNQPQYLSPETYGNTPYPQVMDWQYGTGSMPSFGPPVPGYPSAAYPVAHSVPSMPGYPMAYAGPLNQAPVANEPLKGEVGGLENMKGSLGRVAQASESTGGEALADEPGIAKSKSRTSSKKNVKISGSPDVKQSRKKSGKSSGETAAKKERRRNPWINE
ncbi:LysM peptidoglycan-binding domain-containing protein [Paenibacillus macerans]|uniref:LysM peptidoglycan-binding domain-containing protein n=1 Tax=Paenibacillus macerans TaxID=44252 RepID=UPI003D319367